MTRSSEAQRISTPDQHCKVALSEEAQGNPVKPPEGFATRKAWDLFLTERGIARG